MAEGKSIAKAIISKARLNRRAERACCEKEGDAQQFKKRVDKWRMWNGFKPMYEKENQNGK